MSCPINYDLEKCSSKEYNLSCETCVHYVEKISGLTTQELRVMNKICGGYSEFLKLETQHPSEMQDFVNAIHAIQGILAMRVIRRGYPEYWLTHKAEK